MEGRVSFATTLRKLRLAARLRQKVLGRKLGVTGQTIGRWEKGTRGPTQKTLRLLVAIFHPIDPASTAKLAEARGFSLAELGIAPPPTTPTTATVSLRDAVDVVVLASAESSGAPITIVRAVVGAAIRKAREMGLSLETLERGIASIAS